MKVILKQTIDALGLRGQIVEVKTGYGRNYLIPKGLAEPATESNLNRLQHERRIIETSLLRERTAAEEAARSIEGVVCTVSAKAGEGDKLYGSVTNMDIAQALAAKGIEIDRKKIVLEEPIKQLGEYEVAIRLYPKVAAHVKVEVVRE